MTGEAWILPAGWTRSGTSGRCRSCGAPVIWATNDKSGARSPFDPDGTSHFATCPQADRWRRKPAAKTPATVDDQIAALERSIDRIEATTRLLLQLKLVKFGIAPSIGAAGALLRADYDGTIARLLSESRTADR